MSKKLQRYMIVVKKRTMAESEDLFKRILRSNRACNQEQAEVQMKMDELVRQKEKLCRRDIMKCLPKIVTCEIRLSFEGVILYPDADVAE